MAAVEIAKAGLQLAGVLSPAELAKCCIYGPIGNLLTDAGKTLFVGAFHRRRAGVPQNHDVLKALHNCFVASLEQMRALMKAAPNTSAADQDSLEVFDNFVTGLDLAGVDFTAPLLPAPELDAVISAIYAEGPSTPRDNATAAVLSLINRETNGLFSTAHAAILASGYNKSLAWAEYFELYWAEVIKTDQRVRAIVTDARQRELVALARQNVALLTGVSERLARVGAFVAELRAENVSAHATTQRILGELANAQNSPLASTWVARPFVRMADSNQLFGMVLAPSRQEFERGLVHSPALADDVETALLEAGSASVLGQGAAGKTTLAISLAYRPALAGLTAYYADLTIVGVDHNSLTDAVARCMRSDALLIIDNVHLRPEVAQSCVSAWRDAGQICKLLLLGRLTKQVSKAWKAASRPEQLDLPKFTLRNGTAELEGVFRRLAFRSRGQLPEPVPAPVLEDWKNLFAGDMLAFSAAISQKLKQERLKRTAWNLTLTGQDAREYVESEYLEKWPSARNALLDLAAAYIEEIAPPQACFPDGIFDDPVQRGSVFADQLGVAELAVYRLVHPGVARLLLDAAGFDRERTSNRRVDLFRDVEPSQKIAIILALANKGLNVEAQQLQSELWADDPMGWPVGAAPIPLWPRMLRSALADNSVTADDLTSRGVAWLSTETMPFVAAIEATQPHFVAALINYLSEDLPVLATCAVDRLLDPAAAARVRMWLEGAKLGDLKPFLVWARNGPDRERVWPVIENLVLDTDLGHSGLLATAMAADIGIIADFHAFALEGMPTVAASLSARLANDPAVLADKCLVSGADQLVALLDPHRSLAKMLPIDGLLDELLSDARANDVFEWSHRASPQRLAALVDAAPRFKALLGRIDLNKWSKAILTGSLGSPTWFRNFAGKCRDIGRHDLCNAVADHIILTAQPRDFANKASYVNTVTSLSHILSSASSVSEDAMLAFLQRCIPPTWLDDQYSNDTTLLVWLAGAVRTFSLLDGARVRSYLARNSILITLKKRAPQRGNAPSYVAAWLQLFGACSVLFERWPVIPIGSFPDHQCIGAALASQCPAQPDTGISFVEASLWAGLHEWLFAARRSFLVDGELAQVILQAFQAAEPISQNRAKQNAALISWLESGQEAAWCLPMPVSSLSSS